MSKTQLKKYIADLPADQVGEILLQVYDASKEAKGWLDFYLNPDIEGLSEKYRKQIYLKCYGRSGRARRPKLRDCNGLIKTFRTIVQDPVPVADLMLYFMEEVTRVATEKGRYSESYFRTLTGQFRKTLEYLYAYGIIEYNIARLRKIMGLAERCSRFLARGYEDALDEVGNLKS
ncbi:MAG: hypothetical protein K2K93_05675 [Muribaculaceae bacterium]|nr:hypothetical protein [Muribaculaceae bacterium]